MLTSAALLLLLFFNIAQAVHRICETASPQSESGALLLPLAIVSDHDSKSKDSTSWYSSIKYGNLAIDSSRSSSFVHWLGSDNITSSLNYNGRAMEMSDLKVFDNRLLSVDDKLGIVYWIRNGSLVPWVITSTGDGTKSTPFKGEWMTVRDGDLFLGSSGHEIVSEKGEFENDDQMFIRVISANGAMKVEDWTPYFVKLRMSVGIYFPGFMVHEAVQWSEYHKRWFFLPRYASKAPYTHETVADSGCNYLISSSDCFCDFNVTRIGKLDPHKGFSAFQFVPGTNDTIIAALKTIERPKNDGDKHFATYITVFSIGGRILLEDTLVDESKYEGIAFVDVRDCL